jgi:hypothetical protein
MKNMFYLLNAPKIYWLKSIYRVTDVYMNSIIEKLFIENVKGKRFVTEMVTSHCGSEGHWLEKRMGIIPNSKNEPDLFGFEMKKDSPKITLGDFSATEYIFYPPEKRPVITKLNGDSGSDNGPTTISRKDFLKYFGSIKQSRWSWSGKCVPKYNKWNYNGQQLSVNEENEIIIYYSFSKDTRTDVEMPSFLQKEYIVIAYWDAKYMKSKIENKFNVNGFFICKKVDGVYDRICFGRPFTFDYFIQALKDGKIIFDSGMYAGNKRNYSHFRGVGFWKELLHSE